MVRRDTEDSCMMDGEAIERIASVVPAMMEGWWAMAAHQELLEAKVEDDGREVENQKSLR